MHERMTVSTIGFGPALEKDGSERSVGYFVRA